MIAAACENAEKVLADTRKAYGFGSRQGPSMLLPTMDKGQVAKNKEQDAMLRAAVNDGSGKILQFFLCGKKVQFFLFHLDVFYNTCFKEQDCLQTRDSC